MDCLQNGYLHNTIDASKKSVFSYHIGRVLEDTFCELTNLETSVEVTSIGDLLIKEYSTDNAVATLTEKGNLSCLEDTLEKTIKSIKSNCEKSKSRFLSLENMLRNIDTQELGDYVFLWNGLLWQVLDVNHSTSFTILQTQIFEEGQNNESER